MWRMVTAFWPVRGDGSRYLFRDRIGPRTPQAMSHGLSPQDHLYCLSQTSFVDLGLAGMIGGMPVSAIHLRKSPSDGLDRLFCTRTLSIIPILLAGYRWDSPAYLSLSCAARVVLIEAARADDGTNNGRIGLSVRRASQRPASVLANREQGLMRCLLLRANQDRLSSRFLFRGLWQTHAWPPPFSRRGIFG
jgi:hypothetical protein